MSINLSSQSALSIIMASVFLIPKFRYFSKTDLIFFILLLISALESNGLALSFPDGSPIFVVPPPISTIGLCPDF